MAHLARACAGHGARLLHVSTDYVFAGDAATPYAEDAPTDPINAYGRSKLAGERAVARLLPETGYVVRTAWLYGAHGRNFVTTMLGLAATREHLDVVDDQQGQPTWSYALATRLVALADAALAGRAPAGIYHGTCTGRTTWYGLARAAFTLAGLDPDRVRPTTSDRFPRPARATGVQCARARPVGRGRPAPAAGLARRAVRRLRLPHCTRPVEGRMKLTLVTGLTGLILLATIVELLRRRQLREKYGMLWLGVLVIVIPLSLFPRLLDNVAGFFGVVSGVSLVLFLGIVFLLLVCVHLSWEVSALEEETRTLAEDFALLRAQIDAERAARLTEAARTTAAGRDELVSHDG